MMNREPILKVIDIGQELLNRRDVAAIVGFCVDAEEDPEAVRMFQGSICFRFPGQDERGVELWNDPAVQAWGSQLYAHVPHLLYYMDPDPAVGAIALATSAFYESDRIELAPKDRMDYEGFDHLLKGLGERLVAAAHFALLMADPWEPIVARLLDPLDPGLAEATQNTVAATLALSPEPDGGEPS